MVLLTSQLEHTRNLNYQFLQFVRLPLQRGSDAHHNSVSIFFNLVGDVIVISLSTCYHHIFYPMRIEEKILQHFSLQHLVLIIEVVQYDIAKHEPQLLRLIYLWIQQEFSVTFAIRGDANEHRRPRRNFFDCELSVPHLSHHYIRQLPT